MRKCAQYAVTVDTRNEENERGNDNSTQNQNYTYYTRAPGKLRPHMCTKSSTSGSHILFMNNRDE